MGLEVPKQFVTVRGKPVLVYTLESFQRHPLVDSLVVVCLDGWQETVREYAAQFGISKLDGVVTGGATGQESIRNGVYSLEGVAAADDLVVIHDGIRPLMDAHVLTDVLRVAGEFGTAVSSLPYNEQIFVVDEDDPTTTTRYIPRETLRRVSTPQAYRFDLLLRSYQRAFAEEIGIYGSAYANTMMVELGVPLHFAAGSDKNIKLTTPDDLRLFQAYLDADPETWQG